MEAVAPVAGQIVPPNSSASLPNQSRYPIAAAAQQPTYNYYNGYPTPGPQSPSMGEVMSHIYFASNEEWKWIREWGDYDYVVIGSGFCALAFVNQIIENEKEKQEKSKIVVLERGNMLLPTHFQNLPPVFAATLPNQVVMTEIFPWSVSTSSSQLPHANWMHGMVPFFGGRSTLWSAWCPRPEEDQRELEHWPQELKDMMKRENFFRRAEELLNVRPANTIESFVEKKLNTNVFMEMMGDLIEKHKLKWKGENGAKAKATRLISAPLAVGDKENLRNDFTKYSTIADFLELVKKDKDQAGRDLSKRNLVIVADCIVNRLIRDETYTAGDDPEIEHGLVPATAIDTSRGVLPLFRHGKRTAKVILAVGCMPAATLLLNSFDFGTANVFGQALTHPDSAPEPKDRSAKKAQNPLPQPGSTFGAHTISSIVARIPKKVFPVNWPKKTKDKPDISLGAYYLAGYAEQGEKIGQFHVQISMLQDPDPTSNSGTAHKYMPDVVASASPEQLKESHNHVIFVLAILGETEIGDPNGLKKNRQTNDLTSNVTLKWAISEMDKVTWTAMEQISIQLIKGLAGKETPEFWDDKEKKWSTKLPTDCRVDGMVHESSVLPITSDPNSIVDTSFRPRGVHNVYVTGSSLWPTAASWNPTMTMCAFAQTLGDNLSQKKDNELRKAKREKEVNMNEKEGKEKEKANSKRARPQKRQKKCMYGNNWSVSHSNQGR